MKKAREIIYLAFLLQLCCAGLATQEEWKFDTEPCQRTVLKAELFEITVTSIPAYPESSVEIAKRSMAAAKEQASSKSASLFKRWLEVMEA